MANNKTATINFETDLNKLNQLIEEMEHGELDLEQSLKHFEQGVALINQCQTALKKAEQKVQILLEKNQKTSLDPFTTETTEE